MSISVFHFEVLITSLPTSLPHSSLCLTPVKSHGKQVSTRSAFSGKQEKEDAAYWGKMERGSLMGVLTA